jgi:hypothetical protein
MHSRVSLGQLSCVAPTCKREANAGTRRAGSSIGMGRRAGQHQCVACILCSKLSFASLSIHSARSSLMKFGILAMDLPGSTAHGLELNPISLQLALCRRRPAPSRRLPSASRRLAIKHEGFPRTHPSESRWNVCSSHVARNAVHPGRQGDQTSQRRPLRTDGSQTSPRNGTARAVLRACMAHSQSAETA